MLLLLSLACRPPATADPELSTATEDGAPHVVRASVGDGPGPLSRALVVELSDPAPVAVACEAVGDAAEAHLLESAAATRHDLRLLGLRGGTTWRCAAMVTEPLSAPVAFGFVTEAVTYPTMRETHITTGFARPRGYLLTNVGRFRSRRAALAMFDADGVLRWANPLPNAVKISVEALPDYPGGLWWGGGEIVSSPRRVDWWAGETFGETWPGGHLSHHDGKRLGDGRLLNLDLRPNRSGGASFDGFGVRIYDPQTQTFDLDYDSQADLDAGRLPAPVNADDTDPWHANWVDHRDGTVFVSLCSAESIVAIDVATQQIVWTFGEGGDFTVVDASGTTLGAEGFPHCQHGLEVSEDGTDWLVYDNGRGTGASRVVRYTVDADARRATLRWQWTEPGWQLPLLGDADWLADGDLLLTMGDFDEVTRYVRLAMPEETVAWEAWLGPPGNAYRSEWIDGCQVFASVRECPTREARYAELRAALFP